MYLEALAIFIGLIFSDFLNGSTLATLGPLIKPDFILMFVVFFALKKGPFVGIWVGFVGGLLTDMNIGIINDGNNPITNIGLHSLVYTLVGYVIGQFVQPAYRESTLSAVLVTMAASFVARLLILIFNWLFFGQWEQSFPVFSVAIYTGILGGVVWFQILGYLYKLEARSDGGLI